MVWDAELIGKLVVEEGCLRVARSDADISYLPIWPPDFTLSIETNAVLPFNGAGEVVARVGEKVRLSGGEVKSVRCLDEQVRQSLPADCPGPYWIIGDEVGPAEATGGRAVPPTGQGAEERTTVRVGIAVAGQATPTLNWNICKYNTVAGIIFLDHSGGEAWQNECSENQVGIWVTRLASPNLVDNHSHDNTFADVKDDRP